MTLGFVLINASPRRENEVSNKLSEIEEVIDLESLFGEYDFIAKVQTNNLEELTYVIMNKIRTIPGILDTKTLTGKKFSKKEEGSKLF